MATTETGYVPPGFAFEVRDDIASLKADLARVEDRLIAKIDTEASAIRSEIAGVRQQIAALESSVFRRADAIDGSIGRVLAMLSGIADRLGQVESGTA